MGPILRPIARVLTSAWTVHVVLQGSAHLIRNLSFESFPVKILAGGVSTHTQYRRNGVWLARILARVAQAARGIAATRITTSRRASRCGMNRRGGGVSVAAAVVMLALETTAGRAASRVLGGIGHIQD
jgi:hypothetical protein